MPGCEQIQGKRDISKRASGAHLQAGPQRPQEGSEFVAAQVRQVVSHTDHRQDQRQASAAGAAPRLQAVVVDEGGEIVQAVPRRWYRGFGVPGCERMGVYFQAVQVQAVPRRGRDTVGVRSRSGRG